jgi:hypothetical protein
MGHEQPTETQGKRECDEATARHTAHFGPDLARIIDAWPRLPADRRTAMLAIVDSTADTSE